MGKSKFPITIETKAGKLVIRKNRKGELIWRVIAAGNHEKISGSTEGHGRMRTVERSLEITVAVLTEASGKL